MKCKECKREPPGIDIFSCDACKSQLCQTCGEISPTEIRVLQLKGGRTLRFICKTCTIPSGLEEKLKDIENNLISKIKQLQEDISNQDKKLIDQTVLINRLTKEIYEMKDGNYNNSLHKELKYLKDSVALINSGNIIKSYANVVSREAVVIKPKNVQDSDKTKEELIEKLNPSDIEVGIAQMKSATDGGIIIKCKTREDTEKIKKAAEECMGNQYKIKIPEQKNPCVKIVDFDEDMKKEELIHCLKRQNAFLTNDSELEVIVIKKMKTKYMAIVECDPVSHSKLLEEKIICIGWSHCRVFDYVRILRCYNCGGYNHTSDKCKKNNICINCGEIGHNKESCEYTDHKCLNCIEANNNHNCNFNINHSIFDIKNCQVYHKIFNIQKQKVRATSK